MLMDDAAMLILSVWMMNRVMKSDITRISGDIKSVQASIKENNEKIKINRQLPYLISNVIEVRDDHAS